MKKIIVSTIAVSLALSAANVFAAPDQQQSMQTADQVRTYMTDEMVGIKPQIGVVNFTNAVGEVSNRLTYGFGIDFNAASLLSMDYSRWYLGPQTGFSYSHLGNPSSDFVGSNATTSIGQGNANFIVMPLNLKAGYAPLEWLRVSAHGGGNVIYRSVVNSIALGSNPNNWAILPNVGADVEFAVTQKIGVTLRPDWTVSGNSTVFNGSLLVGMSLN